MKSQKKITINEIAQKAMVSKTSVSFAFNDPTRISKATYERIMDIANECGYIPNPVARSLTTKRIGTIGLLLPQNIQQSFKNPFHSEFLQGLGDICVEMGFSVTIVTPLHGDINKSIKTASVDGFVAVGLEEHTTTFKILKNRHIPFICIDVDTPPDIPCIVSDDKNGAYMLMDYVLQLGHRDIVFLSFKPAVQFKDIEFSLIKDIRLSGYYAALKKYGLNQNNSSIEVIECECSIEGGEQAAKKIFSRKKKPTVIIGLSDIMAIGVFSYCKKNGITIPDDVSLCGFDDLGLSSLIYPRLTTISQNIFEKGRKAGAMLLDLLNKKEIDLHVCFETKLIIRESLVVANQTRQA